MRTFIISLVLLLLLSTFTGVQSFVMSDLAKQISEECAHSRKEAQSDDWEEAILSLEKIEGLCRKRKTWAALTINSEKLKKQEILLERCKEYAKHRQASAFAAELSEFELSVRRIAAEESFDIEEIL